MRSIRLGFLLLERSAPGLGARWAERLWFTLPRGGAGRPGRGQPAAGERFTVAVGGRTVAGRAWGDGEPVYLVHGWGGSGGQLGAFVEPLVGAGYRVVAFDAPSHGASAPGPSGPRSSNVLEFAEALRAVVAVHGPPHAVLAHSLGCLSTAVALRDGVTAGRLVFLAPVAGATSYTHDFARRLGFGERVRVRLVRRIERRVGVPMSRFDLAAIAGQLATPPLLVVHDRDDRETRWTGARDLSRAWPDARLQLTTGLGHRRVLSDPEVVAEAVRFVGAAAARPDLAS